jgi:methylaspartate mutase sigma subunit
MKTESRMPYRADRTLEAVLSSTSSDSHMWNLIFIQLVLEEHGYLVTNLGACAPVDVLADRCAARPPTVVVLSTVNGHGHLDGALAVRRLRQNPSLATTPIVIGGKLGIQASSPDHVQHLRAAGFDAVFGDTAAELSEFRAFLRHVADDAFADVPSCGAAAARTPFEIARVSKPGRAGFA